MIFVVVLSCVYLTASEESALNQILCVLYIWFNSVHILYSSFSWFVILFLILGKTVFGGFFGVRCGDMWKFPGQRPNSSHSSDLSCCSDNPRSLTHFATKQLPTVLMSWGRSGAHSRLLEVLVSWVGLPGAPGPAGQASSRH